MRVRAPLHSIDVRGRFGSGVIFSIWKGRNYAKKMAIPTNPESTRQLAIRGILTTQTRAWGDLTDAQREQWKAFAENQTRKNVFGEDVKLSGFNEFVSLAALSADMGETPVSVPPETANPGTVTGFTAGAGATEDGEIAVEWTDTYGAYVDVWLAGPLPAGRKAGKSDFRHNAYPSESDTSVDITGLTPGGIYEVKVRIVRANGQAGNFLKTRTTASSGI